MCVQRDSSSEEIVVKMFIKCALVICAVFAFSEAAVQLPSYFSQCKENDAELDACIQKSANAGIREFIKGDPSVHVIPMTPLHVPEMYINVDGNLIINITNADIFGIETTVIDKFKWDFEAKKFSFDAIIDQPALIGTYDIAGRILILPINGQGPCNITYVKGIFHFSFDYEIEEKHNKEYYNVVKGAMKYDVDRAYFKLEKLFNGDKRLGEEMAKFLDENWKEVNGEIGVRVGDALAEVFQQIIKSFMNKVPKDKLFGKKL